MEMRRRRKNLGVKFICTLFLSELVREGDLNLIYRFYLPSIIFVLFFVFCWASDKHFLDELLPFFIFASTFSLHLCCVLWTIHLFRDSVAYSLVIPLNAAAKVALILQLNKLGVIFFLYKMFLNQMSMFWY